MKAASPAATTSRLYPVRDQSRLMDLCGPHHRHLHVLDAVFSDSRFKSESQGGGIMLSGRREDVDTAEKILGAFERRIAAGSEASEAELRGAIAEVAVGAGQGFSAIKGLKKSVNPQTPGQAEYVKTLNGPSGLIFGVGPAGTGKTFLAVAAGVSELMSGAVERLIVARPAVEAGEKLGFLPGDFEEKLDPYMLPVWDALRDLMGQAEVDRRRGRGEIELAPLAFMRGRTLKNAFVVIDEAQNATVAQMKMLLTRLGRNSRMVVTGDPTQVDLPGREQSGLIHALRILNGVKGIDIVYLTGADVVRHELVGRIIDAYASDESRAK